MDDVTDSSIKPQKLIDAAYKVLGNSYSPYSNFAVAAAVVDENGNIYSGVNVENASYGLTICAERVAVFSAIAGGAKKICAVAVVTRNNDKIMPCGACRQVLAEFCGPDVKVYTGSAVGQLSSFTMDQLLPLAFSPSDLKLR